MFRGVYRIRAIVLAFSRFAGSAGAEGVWLSMPTGTFDVPVRSMQELKFTETIRQGFDFSCGSAALATLLTYHYDREMNEFEIFTRRWDDGDQEKIKNGYILVYDRKQYTAPVHEEDLKKAEEEEARKHTKQKPRQEQETLAQPCAQAQQETFAEP